MGQNVRTIMVFGAGRYYYSAGTYCTKLQLVSIIALIQIFIKINNHVGWNKHVGGKISSKLKKNI